MPRHPILEICSKDLFTAENELLEKYNPEQTQRVLRLRDMYNYYISNPDSKDRQFIDTAISRFGISKSQAYSDLTILKTLKNLQVNLAKNILLKQDRA